MMTAEQRTTWLAGRRAGLGSSDAAVVTGHAPWGSPHRLYLDKLGLIEDEPASPSMRFGLDLEPLLARAFEREFGCTLERCTQQRHPHLPWMLANPDFRVVGAGSGPVKVGDLVECKYSGEYSHLDWGEPMTDQVPPCYLIQAQHQLEVSAAPRCWFSVAKGGDYVFYLAPRHGRLAAALTEIERRFWTGHVEPKVPPPWDWEHHAAAELASCHLVTVKGKVIDLPADVLDFWNERDLLGRQIAELTERRDKISGHLRWRMLDAEAARLPGGFRLVRRTVAEAEVKYRRRAYDTLRLIEES